MCHQMAQQHEKRQKAKNSSRQSSVSLMLSNELNTSLHDWIIKTNKILINFKLIEIKLNELFDWWKLHVLTFWIPSDSSRWSIQKFQSFGCLVDPAAVKERNANASLRSTNSRTCRLAICCVPRLRRAHRKEKSCKTQCRRVDWSAMMSCSSCWQPPWARSLTQQAFWLTGKLSSI